MLYIYRGATLRIYAYMAIFMECKNKKECKRKSENWIKNQSKFCPVGEKEFESFREKYEKGKAIIEFDRHFVKRSFERVVTQSNIIEAIKFGWVIERNKTMGQVSIVILAYVGKSYRPIHIVFNIVDDDKWIAVTTYSPSAHSWKWSKGYDQRICFCEHEEGCE